jgi:hypothetical protein
MYIDLFVILEDSEIKIFLLYVEDGVVKIKEKTTIQSPGIECSYAHKHIGNEMDTLLLSFKDGSMFFIGEEIKILKPILDEKKTKLSFKNLDFLSIYPGPIYLLLGNDQYIYAIIEEEELSLSNLVKIGDKNKYDHGRFLSNGMIGCISKGVIDIYRINRKNHIYRGILQMTFDAHFMDITSVWEQDDLLFTTSKDSVLKAFHYGSMQMNTQYNFKLIRSKYEINYLVQINYQLFLAYSNDSS